MSVTREILTARLDDGTFVAVSPKKPRFCVSGPTKEAALEKAKAAFAFSDEYRPPRQDETRRPITVHQPDYSVELLVA